MERLNVIYIRRIIILYKPDYPFNERAGVLVRNVVYVMR